MTDDYTPSMEEIRRALGLAGTKWQRGAFDRAIATHDAELRAEIETKAFTDAAQIVQDTARQGGGLQTAEETLRRLAATIAEGKS